MVDASAVISAAIECSVVHTFERGRAGSHTVVEAVFFAENDFAGLVGKADVAVGFVDSHNEVARTEDESVVFFRYREITLGRGADADGTAFRSVVARSAGEYFHDVVVVGRECESPVCGGDDNGIAVEFPAAVFTQGNTSFGNDADCGVCQIDGYDVTARGFDAVFRHVAGIGGVAEKEFLFVIIAVAVGGNLERAGLKFDFTREFEGVGAVLRQRQGLPQIPAAGCGGADEIENVVKNRVLLVCRFDN